MSFIISRKSINSFGCIALYTDRRFAKTSDGLIPMPQLLISWIQCKKNQNRESAAKCWFRFLSREMTIASSVIGSTAMIAIYFTHVTKGKLFPPVRGLHTRSNGDSNLFMLPSWAGQRSISAFFKWHSCNRDLFPLVGVVVKPILCDGSRQLLFLSLNKIQFNKIKLFKIILTNSFKIFVQNCLKVFNSLFLVKSLELCKESIHHYPKRLKF